jgi:hypothetical protein
MKAIPPNAFLEACRANAKTSADTERVLNDIESKIHEAEGERTTAGNHGRTGHGKAAYVNRSADPSLRDLQSAHDGYCRRREQLSKQEEAESKQALIVKHRQQSDELEAATKEFAAAIEKARVVGAPRWPGWQSSTNARWANWRPMASDALAERQASSATRSVKSGAVMVCPSTAGASISA